jgi:hypothetical protein
VNSRQDRTGGLIAGGVLIALGVVFLVRDRIDIDWGLIWPFFLIVPGAFVLVRALFVNDHRDKTGGFIGGTILVFLGGVFLFQNFYDLDWSKVWPFFLIIPGVGLLLGAFLGWGRRDHHARSADWGAQQAPPPPAGWTPPPPPATDWAAPQAPAPAAPVAGALPDPVAPAVQAPPAPPADAQPPTA